MQELNELKNLVIQSLEANGSLSNIRAQIRASVFKVIDQQDNSQAPSKKPSPFAWENPKYTKLLENENGIIVLQLIKEFLQFYNMDYSNSVFSSESNLREEVKREKINEKLQINKLDSQKPLLLQLVDDFKAGRGGLNSTGGSQSAAPSAGGSGSQQDQKKQAESGLQKGVGQNGGRPQQEQQQVQQQRQMQNNYQDLLGDDDYEQSLDSQSDQKPSHTQNKPITSPQQDDKSVQSLESTSEKKALQEAQQFIQKSQNQLRSGQIGSLPVGQQQQQQQQQHASSIQQQNKYNANMKQYEQDHYDQYDEDIEGVEEQLHDYQEDLDVDDDILNSKGKNAGTSNQSHFEESEDYIGQSSKGHDISVDSYALENFDHVEKVESMDNL